MDIITGSGDPLLDNRERRRLICRRLVVVVEELKVRGRIKKMFRIQVV
ncbi:hypothetical protein A2U01_0052422, partial [Trifolium medium]|nr:hypothetical protein [Trifolium medium]